MTEGMRHGLLAGDPDTTEAEKYNFILEHGLVFQQQKLVNI